MRCYGRLLYFAVLSVLVACSGGSSTTTRAIPPTNAIGSAPSINARSVELGRVATSATLPVIADITGMLHFPAVDSPTTISLSASAVAPAGFALDHFRRPQSSTLTVYEYFTIVSATTVLLPSLPAITLKFPASTPLAGKSVYYGISDLNAQGGLVSFNTQGPGTLSGQTVSFAQVSTPITWLAGHTYTFVIYATATATAKFATKIYLASVDSNTITTYNADGTRTTPTITAGINGPYGVAVDAAGKIYVGNSNAGSTITTYRADGVPSAPTINGDGQSIALAVGQTGKIYVAYVNVEIPSDSALSIYGADGTPSNVSIRIDPPSGVAVDASGKIYVASPYSVGMTTFTADGVPSTPTISAYAVGIAVDTAGKIYIANDNTVTTYNPDGTRSPPTIAVGLDHPDAVAVDAAGKIYVANSGGPPNYASSVTTYNPDGSRTTPTITGLHGVTGIAVH